MQSEAAENHKQDARKEMLFMAAKCFAEKGYCGTTLDSISSRLGCTIGRIYHFYPTKMDLFLGVHWKAMETVFEAITPIYESGSPPFERLCRMSLEHTKAIIRTLPFHKVVKEGIDMHFRMATTPDHRSKLEEVVKSRLRYASLFRDVLEQCRQDGRLVYQEAGIAIQLIFMSLNAPAHRTSNYSIETDNEIEDIARETVIFALTGLGADKERILL
ncbi:MAG: TetR/AcrR family transcriptional regulator [Methyloligellaceae bacterium]